VELAGEGTDTVLSSANNYMLSSNVENLTLTGGGSSNGTGNTSANTITGNTGANRLRGEAGNDTLNGGDGNDTLDGGNGDDSMVGGTGNDLYIVGSALDVVVEGVGAGTDTVESSITYTLSANVENLTLTGKGSLSGTGNTLANAIVGNSRANLLSGLDGADTITGGKGNDTLDGGTGNDSLIGGADNDVYIVDSASDVVVEAAGEGVDRVDSSVTYTLGNNVENLTLTGTSAINGTGNDLANVIIGNTGNNSLTGGLGLDTLDGGAGDDSLEGGAGDDIYLVDSALDIVSEAAGGGIDTVRSTVNVTLAKNVENLEIQGSSGLTGTGNASANRLTGNSGANVLDGAGGNDTLIGGNGNDTLIGGTGADTFVFTGSTNGVDTISDFNALDGSTDENDVLGFQGLLTGVFEYLGAATFTAGGHTEARVVGSNVLMDYNGDGTVDQTITLTGLTSETDLTAADFFFFT
jgi:Ca2+-binding RTX toxin-like protein